MKKLLALILCVMLFVSVIPTAAFAATDASSGKPTNGKGAKEPVSAKTIAAAIKAANDATKEAYANLAGEEQIVAAAMSFDSIVKSVSAQLKKTLVDAKIVSEDEFAAKYSELTADSLKAALKTAISTEYNKLAKNATTTAAKAEAYAKAVSNVLSDTSKYSTDADLVSIMQNAYLIAAEEQINKDYAAAVKAYNEAAAEVYEKTVQEINAAVADLLPDGLGLSEVLQSAGDAAAAE